MRRTIITNVGISSLVNRSLIDYYSANLARLQDDLRSNRARPDALRLCIGDLQRGLRRVWDTRYARDARRYREDSPAEVAALSLLEVAPDDRIVLLHADTEGGAFCSSLVEAALQIDSIAGGLGYPRCAQGQIHAAPVKGLLLTDDTQSTSFDPATLNQTFMREGLSNYVAAVCGEYRELCEAGQESVLILNVTSGYRGVLPAARDTALLLAADARRRQAPVTIRMCCLFQSADDFVWFDALPLAVIHEDLPPTALLASLADPGAAIDTISPAHRTYFEPDTVNRSLARLSPLGAVAYALQRSLGW